MRVVVISQYVSAGAVQTLTGTSKIQSSNKGNERCKCTEENCSNLHGKQVCNGHVEKSRIKARQSMDMKTEPFGD
jgi:hypothetical protein